jgi:hypothetical protein
MPFADTSAIEAALSSCGAPPAADAGGADKKNYTERLSHALSQVCLAEFVSAGVTAARLPTRGRDKQFMGGLGPKGVDLYVADEKHGLLLSSGTKGLMYDVRKNLLNRFRDMVAEALELHMRFPYAVCGHVLFIDSSARETPARLHGTVLQRIVVLLDGIASRRVPADPPELYEQVSLLLLFPSRGTAEIAPSDVPESLHFRTYFDRMLRSFEQRNPFYEV